MSVKLVEEFLREGKKALKEYKEYNNSDHEDVYDFFGVPRDYEISSKDQDLHEKIVDELINSEMDTILRKYCNRGADKILLKGAFCEAVYQALKYMDIWYS